MRSVETVQKPRAERSRPDESAVLSSLDSDEVHLKEALALELFGVCAGTLKKYGLDRKRLAMLAAQAMTGDHMRIPVATKILSDMRRLGELGNKWAQDYKYLDADGRPKILDVYGRGMTLQSLSREFFGKRPVEEIVELGCDARLMQRFGADKVAHFGGCVMFTGNPTLMLAYSVRSVLWSMNTAVRNRRPKKEGTAALPDRTAFAVLPAEELPGFIKVMRSQVSALIEMSDRWLTARSLAKRRKKPGKLATIGIQAYVFKNKAGS